MKVEFEEVSPTYYTVHFQKFAWVLVGKIDGGWGTPFSFHWVKDEWKHLKPDECEAVLAAVEPKVTILNIAQRLTK